MTQSMREKIALVVFLALIAATLAGITAYLHVGHSWNRAAASIDDASGDMEGYVAIVYRGLSIPSAREAVNSDAPVPVTAVVRSYEQKGAKVLRVGVQHPQGYDGEDIYLVGHVRIGVFYAPQTMTPFAIERRVTWYERHGVDVVVCIADCASGLAGHSHGVDIVLALQDDAGIRSGTTYDGTYFANVPSVGKVGTIRITPEGIVSSKDIHDIPD